MAPPAGVRFPGIIHPGQRRLRNSIVLRVLGADSCCRASPDLVQLPSRLFACVKRVARGGQEQQLTGQCSTDMVPDLPESNSQA